MFKFLLFIVIHLIKLNLNLLGFIFSNFVLKKNPHLDYIVYLHIINYTK